MNFDNIEKLLKIKKFIPKSKAYIREINFYYTVGDFSIVFYYNVWTFKIHFKNEINKYFINDEEFKEWLCSQTQNIKFEKEIQRYLDLKAFL